MIPNLNELPPIPEKDHPLKKLIRPLLAFLVAAAFTGGLIWFYTTGLRQAATEEMNVMGGLRSLAADVWLKGSAPEIRVEDPDLTTEVARLRKQLGITPSIVVVEAENRAGQPMASHELIYVLGERQVLSIRIYLDQTEGKVDLLTFRTGPEFVAPDAAP